MVKASGIDIAALDAKVKDMRKTRSGDLIIELSGGHKSVPAANALRVQFTEKLENKTGPITRLTSLVDVEIVGIDATAEKCEVLQAVLCEIQGEDPASKAERDEVTLTGLWAVNSGHQVATLRMPKSVANRVTSVYIGWMRCSLRIRRP